MYIYIILNLMNLSKYDSLAEAESNVGRSLLLLVVVVNQ